SGKPFQLILSNNKLQGAVLSADVVKYMADSGLLTQIQEELWELQDKVTRNVVQQSRFSNKKMVSLKSFRKKYGI
ncbi:MAG: hypothetical protein Q8P95_02295, partial [bacterium]|nr:hypothetical protein [bacterium]